MRTLQWVSLSLLVHFLAFYVAQWIPLTSKLPQIETIEINLVERPESSPDRQIVRDQILPDEVKAEDSEDPLKFLSAQTQRVREQSRAILSGLTKNRETAPKEEKTPTPNQREILGLGPSYDLSQMARRDLALDPGVSTIGELVPNEISVGSFTALNTDRYLYYSFFARIEELIRFRWEGMVQTALQNTPRAAFQGVRNTYVTELEIWLTKEGHYHSAHLMKRSGITAFDQSAAVAFAQAKNFPNPPRKMVEEDGFIRLKYAFHVQVDPKVLATRK